MLQNVIPSRMCAASCNEFIEEEDVCFLLNFLILLMSRHHLK